MANEVRIVIKGDSSGGESSIDRVNQRLDGMRLNARRVGLALAAFAAVGGIALRSFANEAISSERAGKILQKAVENTGARLDQFEGRIRKVVTALKETTGTSETKLAQALATLTVITGRADLALLALPAALNAATASGRELSSVTDDLARFLSGATDTFGPLGLKAEETAGFMSRLAMVQDKVRGTAEAAVTPTQKLGVAFGEVGEKIGGALMKGLNPIIEKMASFLSTLVETHPRLVEVGGAVLAVATAVTALASAAILAGPIVLGVLAAIAPFALPILAVAAAVGALVAIFMTDFLGIRTAVMGVIEDVLDIFTKLWDRFKTDPIEATGFLIGFLISFFASMPLRLMGIIGTAIGKIIDFFIHDFGTLGPKVGVAIYDSLLEALPKIADAFKRFFSGLLEGIVVGVPDWVLAPLKSLARKLADIMNSMPDVVQKVLPGYQGIIDTLEGFAALAEGGIVRKPTFALLGERGPEAVIPLNRGGRAAAAGAGGFGGNITVNINGPVFGMTDLRDYITRSVRDALAGGGFNGVIGR